MQDFFRLDKFLVHRLMLFIYWLGLFAATIGFFAVLVSDDGGFFAALVTWVLAVFFVRVFSELGILFFSINEHLREIRDLLRE